MSWTVQGLAVVGGLAFFFYRSVLAIPFLLPILPLFRRGRRRRWEERRREELGLQFKEMILSVSTNQKAGYSVENSFREAYRDMELLYGRESVICAELARIGKGLDNNITLERLLAELGRRSDVDDIREFAEVFAIAKRSGGRMIDTIERTAEVIGEKMEVEREIGLLLSARRMEQKIMNVVPFFILIYINVTSRGFFDPLYHNAAGTVLMTGCLICYLAAYALSERIVAIHV